MGNTRIITSADFIAFVSDPDRAVLIDFWAAWCGPCRAVAPILEALASEHSDVLVVGKVNVDDESELASRFEIKSIPTLVLFQHGEPIQQFVGARPKQMLWDEISSILERSPSARD